jgi:hypothetical protein
MNRALWSLAAIGGRMNGIKWALLTGALLTIALSAITGRLDPIGPLSPVLNASIYVFLAGATATLAGLDALNYYVADEVAP